MAVNKVLPIGTKVVLGQAFGPFKRGTIARIVDAADELDGWTHKIASGEYMYWSPDSAITEVPESPRTKLTLPTEKHYFQITFSEITAGMAKGKYKEGQRFKTNAYKGSDRMIYAVLSRTNTVDGPNLIWEDNSSPVQLTHSIIRDPWFIETEVTAESAQLGLVEEFTTNSITTELFEDGSALLEITEDDGNIEAAIGLTARQVEKLHYFLLTGNTEKDW